MIKVPDNKISLKDVIGKCNAIAISVAEESYFITVFDVYALGHYTRVYHVHSECAYFFKCTNAEMAFWREYFGI